MDLKPKRSNVSLGIRTFKGQSGQTYVVFKSPRGAFHVFAEVEAKEAARDCGAMREASTRQMWQAVWDLGGES